MLQLLLYALYHVLRACLLQCLLQLERPPPDFLLPSGVEAVIVLGVGVELFGLLRLGLRVRSAADQAADSNLKPYVPPNFKNSGVHDISEKVLIGRL